MKTPVSMLFATALVMLPASGSAIPSFDRASQAMGQNGVVFAENAQRDTDSPPIKSGDGKMRVLANLGAPLRRAGNDLWIYGRFTVDGSRAKGILLVYFVDDRVSRISLVTPQRAAALQARKPANVRVAAEGRE